MRVLLLVVMSLPVLLSGLSYDSVQASEGIASIWQLDYADDSCSLVLQAAADCSLCHTIVPQVNQYGQDIADFGFGWFGIEPMDSDGDGRSNGDEIRNDCTLPGDSVSPAEQSSWSRIKALYSK